MDARSLAMRQAKGQEIALLEGAVQRFSETCYRVKSQSRDMWYDVFRTGIGTWRCTCPDDIYRNVKCKHQWAAQVSLALRERVANRTVIEPINVLACPICGSQNGIVRHGVRHNKYGDLQRHFCKTCKRWFVVNLGFERMKATSQIITSAMQLYFTGESLRNVQKFLRLQGVEVSHVAVYKWIKKYVALMQKYLEQIKPQVSDVWRADELYVKIKGNMKYLFAVMDDQTRFLIAQEVAQGKETHDARHLFQLSREATGKKPQILITDGLRSYHDAYLKEFWTRELATRTTHIQEIRMDGAIHNNKQERLNGEIRDRERVVRGIKSEHSPLLEGYQIYHNYIRPHMALEGKTPSEVAGITVKGKDKWLTLIQNASRKSA